MDLFFAWHLYLGKRLGRRGLDHHTVEALTELQRIPANNALTDDHPRVTVPLRRLLDNISPTLQGRQLPVLEQETIENADGTNITTLASVCRHADDLIAGIKGGARDGGGGVCVVQ